MEQYGWVRERFNSVNPLGTAKFHGAVRQPWVHQQNPQLFTTLFATACTGWSSPRRFCVTGREAKGDMNAPIVDQEEKSAQHNLCLERYGDCVFDQSAVNIAEKQSARGMGLPKAFRPALPLPRFATHSVSAVITGEPIRKDLPPVQMMDKAIQKN